MAFKVIDANERPAKRDRQAFGGAVPNKKRS
jgi:hypothetical protein